MLKSLKKLMFFMRGNRMMYAGAVISVAFAALFALSGPLIIRTTIDSLIGDKPFEIPQFIINVIQSYGGRDVVSEKLWIIGLLFVAVNLLRGVFLYIKGKWSGVAAENTAKRMRETLYNHIQYLSYDWHVKTETGDLVQRCTSDVETIRQFLATQMVEVGRAVAMVTVSLIIMVNLHVKMTLVAALLLPFIFGFAFVFFLKVKKVFKASDEAEGELSTVLQENLTGVRVVKAFARQEYECDKFDEKNAKYRDLTYRLIRLIAWYWAISDILCLTQICLVLSVGAYMASTGAITLGTLVVFVTYEGMLLWPIRQMGRILSDMGKSVVAIGRISEILDVESEEDKTGLLLDAVKGAIEFENVSFSYGEGKEMLKDVSFSVKPGETVAILGPTGSGKSTLMHLLPKLYDYTKGSIRIDGVELRDLDKKQVRENIGIVLQEPFLFSKTMKENIALASAEYEEQHVYEAAKTASVHNVISDFEKGYETEVGERGVTLSGGQKQRVAIARMLMQNAAIMIFDDSLSAVDTETDAQIRRALQDRKHNVTTFIIAHRIQTLSQADKIIVLDDGRVVQMGRHDELIREDGLYRRIYELQGEVEKEAVA